MEESLFEYLDRHIEALLLEIRREMDRVRIVMSGADDSFIRREFSIFDFDCFSARKVAIPEAWWPNRPPAPSKEIHYAPRLRGDSFVLQHVQRAGPRLSLDFGGRLGTIELVWRDAVATIRRGRLEKAGPDPSFVDLDDGSRFTFLSCGDIPWLVASPC